MTPRTPTQDTRVSSPGANEREQRQLRRDGPAGHEADAAGTAAPRIDESGKAKDDPGRAPESGTP